ncbi:MAG TPA: hypothetical protein VK745_26010, partial [Polyangiaceae bacterium]|nr:hypothetical protein [Polyangiaceae bacterium]
MLACSAPTKVDPIDREPAPRSLEAEPGESPHQTETTPKRETTQSTASASGKDSAKGGDETSCPVGMKLVDGDYCTKLELTCKNSWYDKSNKKTVCEEFEPKSTCVGEKVHKRYCMDTYTWPNEKGARPEVMNKFNQAEVKCAAVGKRMCTETEWTLACEGPEMLPFP